LGTWEATVGPIPHGRRWRSMARSVRLIQGISRPGPTMSRAVLSLVTDMWSLMTVPGVWVGWTRVALVVGPWVLMLNTWRCLISREVLLLDWWGVMDTWHLCAGTSIPPGPHDIVWSYLVHISFIWAPMYTNDISVSFVSMSPSQWCSPNWHLGLFMMMPYSCHYCTFSHLYHFMCILACLASKASNTNTCGNLSV
jgi:hypothetical protein